MTTYPNPWDFHNGIKELNSTDNRIKYFGLKEIAMGSPLIGSCQWIDENEIKTFLGDNFGGPAIWNEDGTMAAIPKWTKKFLKGTVQIITILDVKKKEVIQYKRTFNLLQFTGFKNEKLKAINSPRNNPKKIVFDIKNEKVKSTRKL
ncbi:hypothetical protein [Robertkochia flava]|uniref:hypothetical protein n=1 Tax=Robertkochia flava TaxID=3447986 RepID=UPI001CCF14BA|nr:hypothetical protein [Robertkochia marina]